MCHLGEEIVAGDDIYGGSDRLLSQVIPKTGIVVKLVYMLSVFVVVSIIMRNSEIFALQYSGE